MTRILAWMLVLTLAVAACQPAAPAANRSSLKVVAAETFLADIAQNVAGNRIKIEALMPVGVDPHSFEPTPSDVAKVADSNLLIVNGAGFEVFLTDLLENTGGQRTVIEASAGLTMRTPQAGEHAEETEHEAADEHAHEGDPHFWLDPNNVIKYVETIRDGLTQADPEGAAIYRANAEAYIAQLQDLDRWIADRLGEIPPTDRLLVTNHESFGYFADRYGLRIIGTVIPGASSGASPSAQQLAALIDHIRETGAKAIFLETGANPQLARQVASETGVQVVTDLHTHSVTAAGGPAPTYIDMMKANVNAIVAALK